MRLRILRAFTSTFIVLAVAAFAFVMSLVSHTGADLSQWSNLTGFWVLNALIVAGTVAEIIHIWNRELKTEPEE